MDFIIGIVSRNLVIPSNFETIRNSCFLRHRRTECSKSHMTLNWMTHIKSYVKRRNKSNKSLSETYMGYVSQFKRMEIQRFG